MFEKLGFKLTKNKVTEITYKEKCFLEFLDHWGRAPTTKLEFRSLQSLPRIGDLTYVISRTSVVQMLPFYRFKH